MHLGKLWVMHLARILLEDVWFLLEVPLALGLPQGQPLDSRQMVSMAEHSDTTGLVA